MEEITLVNLLGVMIIAFVVPFILGFFARLRIPSVVLELVAGIVFGPALRGKLEAVGFGFLVPVFFVTSGLKCSLAGLGTPGEIGRIAIFFAVLLTAHAVPTLLFRKRLSWRETGATAFLAATNLSFMVVAVTVGLEIGRLKQVTGSALIVAGLLSAVLFTALAQVLLGGATAAPAQE